MKREQVKADGNWFRFHAYYFHDYDSLELCTTENEREVFWRGKIQGMGEVVMPYRVVNGKLTHSIELPDQEESVTKEINEVVRKFPYFTPPMTLWFCRTWLELERGSKSVPVVSDSSGQEEARSRTQADA